MAKAKTLQEFIDAYGGQEAYPVIEVEPGAANWPSFIIKAGDKAAVVKFMNVGEDPEQQHLCIDVYPFVDDQAARASAFGMEVGRRLVAFTDDQAEGSSQGYPGAAMVAVLVGKQVEKAKFVWSVIGDYEWHVKVDNDKVWQLHLTDNGWGHWFLRWPTGRQNVLIGDLVDIEAAKVAAEKLIEGQLS